MKRFVALFLAGVILVPSVAFAAPFTYLKFNAYSSAAQKTCAVSYSSGGRSAIPAVNETYTKTIALNTKGFGNYSVPSAHATQTGAYVSCVTVSGTTPGTPTAVKMFLGTGSNAFPVSAQFFQFY